MSPTTSTIKLTITNKVMDYFSDHFVDDVVLDVISRCVVLDLWVFGLISIFACQVFEFFERLKLVRYSYVACGSRRSFGL